MKTKILLLLLFLLGSLQQGIATTFISGGIEYTILDEDQRTCSLIYVERDRKGRLNVPITVPYKSHNYTVVEIERGAFEWCQEITAVSIPDNITSIGDFAFHGCASLKSIDLPESITSIGAAAFSECYELASIVLPHSLISIGDEAFHSCRKLRNLYIPASVTSIGFGIGEFCDNLKSITVDSDNPNYASSNSALCTKDLTTLLQAPGGYQGIYPIPDSVEIIYKNACRGCGIGLTSFSIPNTVLTIEEYAFQNCDGLNAITIPSSVQFIGEMAFGYCDALKEVILPNSITMIGTEVFSYCSALESITIPSSVKTIGSSAFTYCTNLEEVIIPNSVINIEGGAFSNCTNLDNIMIPNSVINIKEGAFFNCTNLDNIIIPSSVTTIGGGAFSFCEGLTSISIPNSVKTIGESAFRKCSHLKEISIPESISSIEATTFENCTSLKKVSIPASVTNIKTKAFNGCDISEILCNAIEPPLCSSDAFNTTTLNAASLQVPASSLNKYKTNYFWCKFRNISEQKPPEVEQLILDKTSATMVEGETLQLNVTVLPPEATDYELYWTSSDYGVAIVSQTGLVSAVGKGNATIAISGYDIISGEDFSFEATCEIEVLESSGIEDIVTDKEEPIVVYNLQGTRLNVTSKEHLSELPTGMYIVSSSSGSFKYIVR